MPHGEPAIPDRLGFASAFIAHVIGLASEHGKVGGMVVRAIRVMVMNDVLPFKSEELFHGSCVNCLSVATTCKYWRFTPCQLTEYRFIGHKPGL